MGLIVALAVAVFLVAAFVSHAPGMQLPGAIGGVATQVICNVLAAQRTRRCREVRLPHIPANLAAMG